MQCHHCWAVRSIFETGNQQYAFVKYKLWHATLFGCYNVKLKRISKLMCVHFCLVHVTIKAQFFWHPYKYVNKVHRLARCGSLLTNSAGETLSLPPEQTSHWTATVWSLQIFFIHITLVVSSKTPFLSQAKSSSLMWISKLHSTHLAKL